MQDSLATPHVYDISNSAAPGKHTITIRIDNSYKYMIGKRKRLDVPYSHSYTEETQTIWNGIIGQMKLAATDKVCVDDVQVYPDLDKKLARLCIKLCNSTGTAADGNLTINVRGSDGRQSYRC